MSSYDFDVIVLGGGHNGLVCASYLAGAGLKTLVLEKREILGGACATEELFPGYRFSSCSYFCYLFQDKVIDDLKLREHGFHVYQIDPWRLLPLPEGNRVLLWQDDARTQAELGRFSPRDAAGYLKWKEFWKRAAGIVHRYFLTPPPTLAEVMASLQGTDDARLFERLLTSSMVDVVAEFFESPPVRGAFIHAHDVCDPTAPGSAWQYAYYQCHMYNRPENVGIVKGGMGSISQALAAVAKSRGVSIRTSANVEQIIIREGKAVGVKSGDGQEITAKVIVSNADPKRTFFGLVGPDNLPGDYFVRVKRLKANASYFKFHAALTGVPDFSRFFSDNNPAFDPKFLAEVKICPSIGYYIRAWRDSTEGNPPHHPVMEVQVPTAYDPSMAKEGHHVCSIWAMYAPSRLSAGAWGNYRKSFGERIIELITRYAPNFKDLVTSWSLFTPADIERRVGMTNGNIRHLDMVPGQFLAQRPMPGWANYRTPIENLYLCGAGTHPGGEVTGAPGHNAAHVVLKDLGR